jgi:hypothetical protein
MMNGSFVPRFSPLFDVVCVLDGSYSNRRWNLNVILIYISFMARDGGHFFMWFLAI